MDTTLDRLAALDACAASDALDRLGLPGATTGIVPLWPCPKLVGRVSTVRVGPKTSAAPTHHLAAPAIEAADAETVLLIANEGDPDVSCWGDILAGAACAKGVRGVAIDGRARDVDANAALGFPVYARGAACVSARGRLVQTAWDVPIEFGGVTARPGDLVIADGSGTVVVPGDRAVEALDVAERLARREASMIAAVRGGRSVVEVMHDTRFDVDAGPIR